MNLLQLSWKNLTFKPWSTALSLMLFALGIGLISLLLILNHQLDEQLRKNQAGINMVIGAKGSPLQLILSSMYHIDYPTGNIPIAKAKPFMRPGHPLIKQAIPLSLGDSYQGYRIVGTTHEILDLYSATLAEGQKWEKTYEVTLGAAVAEVLKLGLGDHFKSSHGFVLDDHLVHDEAGAFKVVGLLKPTGSVIDQLILTNTQSVWAVHETHAAEKEEDHEHHAAEEEALMADTVTKPLYEYEDQEITSLLIRFKALNAQTLSLPRNINENTDLMAANPSYEIDRLFSIMGTGEKALRVLAIVIMIVSGLSVFISLYSSLRERQYELALIRVMGASPGKLFRLIILEGMLLALLGCLLGLAMSHLGMTVLANEMKDAYRYSFTGAVFLRQEAFLLLGALGIGLLAAVIPAVRARQTDISTTLAEG